MKLGPEFIFLFNPILGPLWHVVGQKIRGGELSLGSEFILEISELSIENLSINGSLVITAEDLNGEIIQNNSLSTNKLFKNEIGSAIFSNVKIKNKGKIFNIQSII